MNANEFKRRLRESARGIDEAVLDAVGDRYADRPHIYPSNVAEAIQEAAKIQASLPGKDREQLFAWIPGSRENLDTDLICDALEPQIVAMRQKYFDSELPPFPGTERAPLDGMAQVDKWLEIRNVRPKSRANLDERRIFVLIAELQSLTGSKVRLEKQVIEFPHKNPTTSQWESKAISISIDSPLFEMANEIQKLKASGFSATALTAWLFTGLRPVIPRMSVFGGFSWTEGMSSERWFTRITINSRDVTWAELWNLYRSTRKITHLKRRKLNPLHSRICQMVREHGGPPIGHGQKRVFWKSIQAQLNKEKEFSNIPRTWEGIRKAYVVATKKESIDGRERPRKAEK